MLKVVERDCAGDMFCKSLIDYMNFIDTADGHERAGERSALEWPRGAANGQSALQRWEDPTAPQT